MINVVVTIDDIAKHLRQLVEIEYKKYMHFKNILSAKFDFSHFTKVFMVEFFYYLVLYFALAIFSLFIFGEGESSYTTTVANQLFNLALLILPTTIFNGYKLFKHYHTGLLSKAKNYFYIQVILTLVLIWLIVVFSLVSF